MVVFCWEELELAVAPAVVDDVWGTLLLFDELSFDACCCTSYSPMRF